MKDANNNIDIEAIVSELEQICTDRAQKTSDRLTAAKLLLDYADKTTVKSDGILTVAFENIPSEYCS
ncbi:MAG: hypothetical protein IJO48_00625 [Clostridia bacterium]|nr:hypothetical protein [Clostridia bacterium]